MLMICRERQESYFTITRECYEAVRFQPSIFSKRLFLRGSCVNRVHDIIGKYKYDKSPKYSEVLSDEVLSLQI